MSNSIEKMIFSCEICGSTDCCKRTDLANEPVLCDECYKKCAYQEYGECNCERCVHSYFEDMDKLRCCLTVCIPSYL